MLNRLDWKFFLTMILTIASVTVPVWLWQLDLSSKSVTLTIKSNVEIQPQGVDSVDGLQVSVDGKPLATPFVSVLELSNTGSRPIVSGDFEGPIRIASKAPSTVVKARLTSATPASLEPRLSLAEGAVLLEPLLLNPGDILKLTLVTANGKPEYSVRGRIAGVTETVVSDAQAGRASKRYWLARSITILLIAIYVVYLTEFVHVGILRRTFLPLSLSTALISAFGAALIVVMQDAGEPFTTESMLPTMVIATLISAPVVFMRLRKRSEA